MQRFLLALILLTTTAHAEVTWTDFSPKSVVVEKSQVVKGRSSAGRAGTFNKKGKSQRSAKF